MNCLVLGATGLTGTLLVDELTLVPSVSNIYCPVRTVPDIAKSKASYQQVDFSQPASAIPNIELDTAFCCLGTTIKVAGSKTAFYHIDVELPYLLLKQAIARGVKKIILISAMGANARSWIFYNRCKGELEQRLIELCKQHNVKLVICRPSLLLGNRNEQRFAEGMGQKLFSAASKPWIKPFDKFQPIHAKQVASAMVALALKENDNKVTIAENNELLSLALSANESL
ncbi:NAD-dependent epimerase/dehydratase family protein [Thalassotalea agarivorans]|uniref:Uncharacterized conserved protein YbjT, contains NAD(P)-binding and DUF2867 domains n=1 Tax=Thalassotalea agarivorans TaxID=349064 RepID=A0A1I0DIX6_THASX|nr:NAD-dependent epimerase/dehydratase family protein [Thalassotalea agarivorans]SET32083.1 Uncharacterized conserved protein YbjT, contains NAD(P)-binding and DUF2867 domains [Thalassotalea agarivorans]